MTDPSVPAAVRFRAAESVLEYAMKGVELEDADLRISALEQALKERKST
jgi:hypothetical protein